MLNLLNVLLFAPPKEGDNPLMNFLPLILILVVFYFFMIRPQMKKQKEARQFREGLKVGDKIITTGGIYGKIAEVREQAVIIEVEDKMRLKVDKAALVRDPSDLEKK
jgi:preprotein translocase subunit YajC